MKWWKIVLSIVLVLLVIGCLWYITHVGRAVREPIAIEDIMPSLPSSPLDASYSIDGAEVQLTGGRFEKESAPDTASKEVTEVWGEPVWGDVNSDGTDDALLFLTYSGGGSGTFYYVAVAVRDGEGFVGSNAIPLGDRIAPQEIKLWHELLLVHYSTHAGNQSQSDPPTEKTSRYFLVEGAQIVEIAHLTEQEQVLAGTLMRSDDSYTFTPCGEETYWLNPASLSNAALEAVYEHRSADNTSVLTVLGGVIEPTPGEGPGADYTHMFTVTALLSAPENDSCDTPVTSTTEELPVEAAVLDEGENADDSML